MSANVVLSIAGSDSSGCAGIQADIKTCGAMGVFCATTVTAVTAQGANGCSYVGAQTPDVIMAQVQAAFETYSISAVKLGMLATEEAALAVADYLRPISVPIVVDPVVLSTSGAQLCVGTRVLEVYRNELLPLAHIVTPNLGEAQWLLGEAFDDNHHELEAAAQALLRFGSKAVLLKGGHSSDERLSTDYLAEAGGPVSSVSAARIKTHHNRGTGCTLSSAIAAGLAQGLTTAQSVAAAKNFLHASLIAAGRLEVADTSGPLHHFSTLW